MASLELDNLALGQGVSPTIIPWFLLSALACMVTLWSFKNSGSFIPMIDRFVSLPRGLKNIYNAVPRLASVVTNFRTHSRIRGHW